MEARRTQYFVRITASFKRQARRLPPEHISVSGAGPPRCCRRTPLGLPPSLPRQALGGRDGRPVTEVARRLATVGDRSLLISGTAGLEAELRLHLQGASEDLDCVDQRDFLAAADVV